MSLPMSLPVLDAVEQRVLGALLEKQRTVPASYPLSAVALRTACNQSSSPDPVLGLDGPEAAVVTVLLLRGSQAPGELAGPPFETWLLDRVAAHARADGGPALDVGTGPQHVAAPLARAGVATAGVDLSAVMVDEARARFPDVDDRDGDLRRPVRPDAADGWSVVVAWFALVVHAPSELAGALAAPVRPLRPGGLLVLGLLAGTAVRHATSGTCAAPVPSTARPHGGCSCSPARRRRVGRRLP